MDLVNEPHRQFVICAALTSVERLLYTVPLPSSQARTTMMLIACLIFASVLVSSHGHICLISPHQRGSMNGINKAGAKDCILLSGPCGGREASQEPIGIRAGAKFTVTWQKNLNHFNASDPGQFVLAIGRDESSLRTLFQGADTSDPSLTLYSVDVTVPDSLGRMVLQAQYVIQNAIFFQCSDVIILPRV